MNQEGELHIGVAGWSYDDWKGVVYPAGQKSKLSFMARYIDCIEVNTSFYRPLNPGLAHKWVREVSDREDFRFTVKLYQKFTHNPDREYPDSDTVDQVVNGFEPLQDAGRLLGVLVQFPFYFRDSPESRERLKRISDDFRKFSLVVEVRDASWAEPEAVQFISSLGMNIACLDMPLTRGSFREKALTTGPIAYLRLHGRNYDAWFSKDAGRDDRYNYLYGADEMDSTIERIQRLRDISEKTVAVWNNHFRGKAVVNALETRNRLSGEPVDVPPLLLKSYPRLSKIDRDQGGPLFEQ